MTRDLLQRTLLVAAMLLSSCTEDPPEPGVCLAVPPPPSSTGIDLEPVFRHALAGDAYRRIPWIVPSPYAPRQWYVVKHKEGVLRFDEDPDAPPPSPALDLAGDPRLFVDNDEAGIVSLAFHPTDRFAFLVYSAPPVESDDFFVSRLSRFTVREDGTLDVGSESVFLEIPQPNFPHSGNHVVFGPDGYLYYGVGDGGTPGSRVNGQDPNTLAAAILRIDVDAPDPVRGTPYSIPDDNPFVAGGGAPEVFAYGLRNPWRFSFDRETGDLWVGDVGEASWEEVNRVVAGGNYGWPIREGRHCFEAETCETEGLIDPIVEYDHDQGISITGGFVYRGSDVPRLFGRYVYADYISGTVWSIDAEDPAPEPRVEAEAGFWIASFAEGPDAEIYAINWTQVEHPVSASPEGGGFYRLRPAPPTERGDFPRRLSLTGCMDADDVTAPAAHLIPYAPRAELWSDGAEKTRFFSLPPGGTIGVEADGDFTFPVGTVLVKHFLFDGRYHETRLLMNHEDVGWRGYSYRWNADQTDAELLDGAFSERLESGVFWRYPSRAGCMICHTGAAGRTLGLEAGQLADDLPSLHGDGRFEPEVTLATLEAFAPLADPFGDAPAEERARSYLHGNCAMCHRPDAPPSTEIDLRFATPFADQGLCEVAPTRGTVGIDDPAATLFTPGAPDLSVLYVRMTHPGTARMPPLGSDVVDTAGSDVVATWIAETTACP